MSETWRLTRRHRESLVSAISAGFFFILAGTILLTTPNVVDKITTFFNDFQASVQVPNMGSLYLPAPSNPASHPEIYDAIAQFALVWGIFMIAMLVLRVAVHSPLGKKADNAGDIAFWLGAYYLITTMLSGAAITSGDPLNTWFGFWAGILTLAGVSLIVRAIVLAAVRLSS